MKSNIKTSRTHISNDKGTWIFCNQCGNPVGFLSDTHSNYFKYHYVCNCGNHGFIEMGHKAINYEHPQNKTLDISRKHMRCPHDDSPLISILDKNIERFEYEVICKSCGNGYHEKI